MVRIANATAIFNTREVLAVTGGADTFAGLKESVMPALKEAFVKGREEIRQRFLRSGKGGDYIACNAFLIDSVLQLLWESALPYMRHVRLDVVAVGGYGKGELFPHSDIDLLFLHEKAEGIETELINFIMYCLWDLGVSLGQAIRTPKETVDLAKADVSICTALLDMRLVAGKGKLFKALEEGFEEHMAASALDFVEAKLAERDARHQRVGDSRYALEPNIKEGKGGLRDLHTLYWLAQYIYRIDSSAELLRFGILDAGEYKDFLMARDFLWRVRVYMHLIAGRAEERLTFDMQRSIAEALEYNEDSASHAVERFMKQYFLVARHVGNLTRSVCAVLEENGKRKPRLGLGSRLKAPGTLGDFHLDGERLAVASENAFREKPLLLLTLFKTAHEHDLDIHPHTIQLVSRSLWLVDARLRRDDGANQAFMDILLSRRNPEMTLRRMSEAGVLGRFIPDFGRVTGQMQFDMYHSFTVDEHTIFALGILHGIGAGKYRDEMPIATEIFPRVKSKRVLFLALLTHDIAKGRGGDHSLLGEMIVRKLGRRFRFDAYEIETCAWLVRQHLLMSRTAFKRDLGDAKTIDDFVAEVQSPERLRLLLLLTVADIRAVGPAIWNGWKGALLRDLYCAAEDRMGASDPKEKGGELARLRAEMTSCLPGWSGDEIERYIDQIATAFGSSFPAATHARVARLIREAEASGAALMLDTTSDAFRAVTDLILCAPDAPGLFSKTSGAIALAGANILSAKIFTLKNGVAIQIFHIQDIGGHAFDKPDKLARLSVFIRQAVDGVLDIGREIARSRLPYPSRLEAFKIPPRVYIENKASANHTVVEVSGRDHVGFLYKVTSVLSDLGLTISTAHISTYGERAVDVFYVKDIFGMKIFHESKIRQIQEAVIAALSGKPQDKGR